MTKEVFLKLHAPGGHLEAKDLTAEFKTVWVQVVFEPFNW